MTASYDVFLSHNSVDKESVEHVAEKLRSAGMAPWLDAWCLVPGQDWQRGIADGLAASACCAVFVGLSDLRGWVNQEAAVALDRAAKDPSFRLFLVLLPGLPADFDPGSLSPFLSTRTWVDLRQGLDDRRGFEALLSAIRGVALGPRAQAQEDPGAVARIDAAIEQGEHEQAIAQLAPLIRAHPHDEHLRYLLVLALYRAGRQSDALEAYQDARRALADGLGREPGAELQALERTVLLQAPEPAAAEPVVLDIGRRPPLPAATTPLVGREGELEAITELVGREDVRIVTLTGPGGTGKTRLAVAAAERLEGRFESGVYFVSLLEADEPALVLPVIAQALGIQESGSRALPALLAEVLAERELLLVLDNFEQVLPAARHIAELLAEAPRLHVLVTSRACLRMRGEHEFPVSPLALPPPDAPPEALAGYPSVELFASRAREVNQAMRLDEAATIAVAEICRRLDGLPLALELAAARVRFLPPESMLQRLERRLDLLPARAQDAPERQRTLRDAIRWSYELLDEEEQGVFRQLGVFAGGCTLEAAEQVIQLPGDRSALEILEALLDNSLVRVPPEAEGRIGMLEVIREFALEELEAAGEAQAARLRHAHYYVTFAEGLEASLQGAQRASGASALERERGNLRAALRFALDSDDRALGQRLAGALQIYSESRDDSIVLLVAEVQRMGGDA